MGSRPLAFILLAGACVAAAGGGAYIATWQHQRATTPAVTTPTDRSPQLVRETANQATTSQAQQATTESVKVAASPAAVSAPAEPAPRAQVAAGKKAEKPAARTSPAPAASVAGVASKRAPSGDITLPAQAAAAAPLPAAPAVDPGAQPQRSWPGAPAPLVPVIINPAAEAAKVDQNAAPPEPDKQWEQVMVPSESVLGLQLESSVDSEVARVEDRVDARVTRDVRVGRFVAIPAGTHAIGSVVLVDRGGKVKGRARLGLRFDTLILPDTTRLTINTETIYREGESPAGQSSAKIGGATIGGAILGAILGGGKGAAIGSGLGAAGGTAAAMNGDRLPVVLPAGTPLSVRTQAPINMTVEK